MEIDKKARDEAGRMVEAARKAKGLSRRELGEKLGYVTEQFIYIIETGKRAIPEDKILPLSRALGLNLAKLYSLCYPDKVELVETLGKAFARAVPSADDAGVAELIKAIRSHPEKARAVAPLLKKIFNHSVDLPEDLSRLCEIILSMPSDQRTGLLMALGGRR